ncbi:uncharacterized protein [Palaemon carinicauda]|uniref:uncharacterized protein n=1 Tax=Palaemon carinicauda TaxID=392227 RepID=UPI0035B5B041
MSVITFMEEFGLYLETVDMVLESVLLLQLNDHLSAVVAIPDSQSAYRSFYSTETASCSVMSDMHRLLDNGKCELLIQLDLSAAFDTIVHTILLRDYTERLSLDLGLVVTTSGEQSTSTPENMTGGNEWTLYDT